MLLLGGVWGHIVRGGAGRGSRGRESNTSNIRAGAELRGRVRIGRRKRNLGVENNLVNGRGMAIVWHLLFLRVLRFRAVHFTGTVSLALLTADTAATAAGLLVALLVDSGLAPRAGAWLAGGCCGLGVSSGVKW